MHLKSVHDLREVFTLKRYNNFDKLIRVTCFFYKHKSYKHIQPGISETNKHMLSIVSSLENSCSFFFCYFKSHSEAYSEPFKTSKMKLLPKIVSVFQPLNIFTKNFILDVWQSSDYASVIFSKVTSLQATFLLKNGLLNRYSSRIYIGFISEPNPLNLTCL